MGLNMPGNNRTGTWSLVESYYKAAHLETLVRHQLESYNCFVASQIPNTIRMFNPVHIVSEKAFNAEVSKHPLEISVTFQNFRVQRPQIHENTGAVKLMLPSEARLRMFTYGANMMVDMLIKYTVRSGADLSMEQVFHREMKNVHIGKLPIMLRSSLCLLSDWPDNDQTGECPMDPGGYFVINGSEKTCLGQERAAENNIQCFDARKANNRWSWTAEIKSVPDFKCISPKQLVLTVASKNNGLGFPIYAHVPRIKQPVPLFVLFRALGLKSDKEICELISPETETTSSTELRETLAASILDSGGAITEDEALDFLASHVAFTCYNMAPGEVEARRKEFAASLLQTDLLPHCQSLSEKTHLLAYMTNRLLRCSLEYDAPSDRDAYSNKRVDLCGTLLNNLFRNYFNKLVKDMQKQIRREVNNGSWRSTDDYGNIINHTNIYKIVKSATIETGLKRALATGDFGIKQTASSKVGVAQVLNRLTYVATLSHLRRINTPIDKSGKLVPPRKLHATSWGFICPAETPEGHSIGVVKNLAQMAHVTIQTSVDDVKCLIKRRLRSFAEASCADYRTGVKVFLNGCWLGFALDPLPLYNVLKESKVNGIISIYTSVVFDYRKCEIRVCTEAGRLCRPILRVRDNQLILTDERLSKVTSGQASFDSLLSGMSGEEPVIEYVDAYEQAGCLIAQDQAALSKANAGTMRYTHCEIHPSTIFGILASCIPFPENNQSPRNTYQCAMGKQAIGVYALNHDNRMDKSGFILSHPMRPLVSTRLMGVLKLDKVPSGCMVIVAIMTHTGYNQEDSILFNEGSVNRGLFEATVTSTIRDEDKKVLGDEEVRGRPVVGQTKGLKFANYDLIGEDGLVKPNSRVRNRDVIIGKSAPIKAARNDPAQNIKFSDCSYMLRTSETSYIDKNYTNRNGDGYTFCKVRVRTLRSASIGDKFSSRHGQKGTMGNLIPECDMPYTQSGLKPDIIINPHAIPSRMTIAQLKETLLGKLLLELGMLGDGTSFGDLTVDSIRRKLVSEGLESTGEEIMYDGQTGLQMESSVFIGPVFYQRLKHMVKDKIHSRSYGPKVSLTRQPAEGRRRDGGHRFGEMERDCMCSHGAASFTTSRMMDASDAFTTHCCRKCGSFAIFNNIAHVHECKVCDNSTSFAQVRIPYSCKLLFQELVTMNVAPRILTE